MTKRYFMAILAYRLSKMFENNQSLQMVRISEQDMAGEDRNRATRFIDNSWLQHLGISNVTFAYYPLRAEHSQKSGGSRSAAAAVGGLSFLD